MDQVIYASGDSGTEIFYVHVQCTTDFVLFYFLLRYTVYYLKCIWISIQIQSP